MIRVVEHDPAPGSTFEAAAVQVVAAGNAVSIHHVGSTAIPLTGQSRSSTCGRRPLPSNRRGIGDA
jgi:hypothetical protein